MYQLVDAPNATEEYVAEPQLQILVRCQVAVLQSSLFKILVQQCKSSLENHNFMCQPEALLYAVMDAEVGPAQPPLLQATSS